MQQPPEPKSDAQPPVAAAPQLSACRLALTDAIAIAPTLPPIHGPGQCGGDDLVKLEAVVLPDKTRVPLHPAATLRCSMASAVADWIRSDIVALATELGTRPSEIDNFDSFDCRGRNRVVGARMSEHGRANALDMRALKLANGQSIALTDRETPRALREKVLLSVCARFSTVLGPGSDGYHEDHVHLDLAERRNNYRICQWMVWDAMPQIAPLLPAVRPDDAPPRSVAVEQRGDEPAGTPTTAAPTTVESDTARPEADNAQSGASAPAVPGATVSPEIVRSGTSRRNAAKTARRRGRGSEAVAPSETVGAQTLSPPVGRPQTARPQSVKPPPAQPDANMPLRLKPAINAPAASNSAPVRAKTRPKSRRHKPANSLPPPFNFLLR